MSTFCLVHGSTQSPRGWDPLVSELESRGHRSICVDLPVNEPQASATRYAAAIGRALNGGSEAIVVGHSASGLFLPLVPDYAPVGRLVYLGAVLPLPGASFFSQFQSNPAMYRPGFAGKDPTKDPAIAREYLFHDCPPERIGWALSTLRLMFAKQAILEVSPLEKWPEVPSSYILCTEDRAIDPAWWERAVEERLGAHPIRIEAGHAPHVSRPAELAEILDSIAK